MSALPECQTQKIQKCLDQGYREKAAAELVKNNVSKEDIFEPSDYHNGALFKDLYYCWSQTLTDIGKIQGVLNPYHIFPLTLSAFLYVLQKFMFGYQMVYWQKKLKLLPIFLGSKYTLEKVTIQHLYSVETFLISVNLVLHGPLRIANCQFN